MNNLPNLYNKEKSIKRAGSVKHSISSYNSNSILRKNSSIVTNREKKFDIPNDKNRKI